MEGYSGWEVPTGLTTSTEYTSSESGSMPDDGFGVFVLSIMTVAFPS